MKAELSPRARGQLFEILEYLARERRSLAVNFLADFGNALNLLADFSYAGAISDPPVRKLRLRRFRYEVFYRVQGDVVQVAGLVHMSRGPGYWRGRVEEVAPDYAVVPRAA